MRSKRKDEKKVRLLIMDELDARPCEVDGRPALFHRWVEEYTMQGYTLEALVEYQDGTIAKVEAERIKFIRGESRA